MLIAMPADQFQKGLENIRSAIDEALREHEIQGSSVSRTPAGPVPGDVVFTVTVQGEAVNQKFTQEEIVDSGEAIDHLAAMKVRILVSPFVR